MRSVHRTYLGPLLFVMLAHCGCSSDENGAGDGAPDLADAGSGGAGGSSMLDGTAGAPAAADLEWPTLDCDPLVPSYCAFPFPSNVFTEADASTPTGLRVKLSAATLPIATTGAVTLPDPWTRSDGFSPGAAILAHFPGAAGDDLVPPTDIARSLSSDSVTVLLNAETGELAAHFSELDLSGSDPQARSLLIRPVVRLDDATRYIVAVQNLRGPSGTLEPSPAFRALRDGTAFDEDPSIEARRELYEDIFTRLDEAGIGRSSLQLAWDFTTASRENNTGRLIHMRDEAFDIVGSDGPEYQVLTVEPDPWGDGEIAFRIAATVKTPLYLTAPGPGTNLVFGDDGLPEPSPTEPFMDVDVEILIPQSAMTEPAKLLQYGHGLLGQRSQIESGHFRSFIDTYNYIMFGVNMIGMAEDDPLHIAGILGSGEFHLLTTMYDRLHQGMLNSLMAMRMMSTSFSRDPDYGSFIDPESRYYYGISQGGIFGGVYMAVSTDVKRGVLGVMGQPYNLLLNRSVDFDTFAMLLDTAYPSAIDQQFGLTLTQMLWDRLEPNGYTRHIQQDMLPGTPAHSVLMRAAIGDYQVTPLGAHVMARAIGAQHLDSGLRDVFGLETVASVASGSSGYVEYDFGTAEAPICNIPPQADCDDPHGKIRTLDAAREQMHVFLTTGQIDNFCPGSVCSYPEQSGCAPGATNDGVCSP